MYCVWQVVETPTIISNHPVYTEWSVEVVSVAANYGTWRSRVRILLEERDFIFFKAVLTWIRLSFGHCSKTEELLNYLCGLALGRVHVGGQRDIPGFLYLIPALRTCKQFAATQSGEWGVGELISNPWKSRDFFFRQCEELRKNLALEEGKNVNMGKYLTCKIFTSSSVY